MRTTLDITDDVLFAVKDYALRDKKTLGEVVSALCRRAIFNSALSDDSVPPPTADQTRRAKLAALGLTPLPRGNRVVTDAVVNQIRESEGI